jgi:hypothetical protein
MRCTPISPKQTKIEDKVCGNSIASDEDFNNISDCFKHILKKDKDLCNAAQKNLNAGVSVNGELHPWVEMVHLNFKFLFSTYRLLTIATQETIVLPGSHTKVSHGTS